MTLRLYGEGFQKKESKMSLEEKKDNELSEFLEMGLHEQKKIVDTSIRVHFTSQIYTFVPLTSCLLKKTDVVSQ